MMLYGHDGELKTGGISGTLSHALTLPNPEPASFCHTHFECGALF